MKRSLLVLAAVAVAVLALAACGDGARTDVAPEASSSISPTSAKAPTVVEIKDFLFHPDGTAQPLTIKAGEPITFNNVDAQPHTATSDTTGAFDTGNIAAAAASTPLVIETPGTYAYHCSFHPFMHGKVVVQ